MAYTDQDNVDPDARAIRLRDQPDYLRLWSATTVSGFGSAVTTVALQVLVVVNLHASATEVGVLNAARWVPYLLFGLIAGVLVDRYRRLPVLIGSDLGRAAMLCAIPVLTVIGRLSIATLVVFMLAFGVLSLANDAAYQSFLPRLVAPAVLTRANARLEQSGQVAQTTGPLLAGGLIGLLSAPLAILVDALSYLASGIVLATVRTREPRPAASTPAGQRGRLWREIREGLSWVYRHPMLAPLALTTHLWFVFNAMLMTVFVPYVLRELGLTAFDLGVAYAFAGDGGVLGSALSERAGRRWGAGPAVIVAQALFPLSFLVIVLAPTGVLATVLVSAGQLLFGLALGLGSPLELGYRQSVTPDRLQGRMNATNRSINRGVVVLGAPAGGMLADVIGYHATLWVGIGGVTVAAVWLALSRFRHAELAG